MPLDRLSINGKPYDIAPQEGSSRRSYIETMRPSQPFETTPLVLSWATWGPLGNSRTRYGGPLATDYADNLEHRYDYLLTSTAKRNAITLTTIGGSPQYGVPIADTSKTNWTLGAGSSGTSTNAFDELDEGIISGAPDDATSYWTTSTALALISVSLTSLTDPLDNTNHVLRVRFKLSDITDTVNLCLLQGTDFITYAVVPGAMTTAWQTGTLNVKELNAANITDYTNLKMFVQFGAGASGTLDVSALELEIPDGSGGNCVTIDEDRGSVFVQRGAYSTQINPGTMTEQQNVDHGSLVTDSVASWNGTGHVALGTSDAIQNRTAVTASTSTYANVTNDIEASKMAVGPDRLWFADPDDNFLYYTLGAVSTATISNAVKIVDPAVGHLTGIYTIGENMVAGTIRGPRSFTDDGSPAILGEATAALPSSANGASGGSLWGWHYEATKLGLFAYQLDARIENPVGPGEGLEGLAFEGPIDGYPTAVKPFKDSLWVAYLNPDGTTYIFRGTLGPNTPTTGRPEWYSYRKLPALTCTAIGATGGTVIGATLIVGEDDNVAYYDLGLRGREVDGSNYTFDTGGGSWFGTTVMMPIGVRANVRWAKLFTENCVASTDTWTVAVDVDDAGSYINIGSAVTGNGAQTVRPVAAGVPLTTVGFTSLKPRLTQVASSETAPPQIRGELAIGIDARPEHVREIDVLLKLETAGQLADIQALIGDDQIPPVKMRLPTQTAVNTDLYGHVITADWHDRSKPTDNVALVKLRQWDLT